MTRASVFPTTAWAAGSSPPHHNICRSLVEVGEGRAAFEELPEFRHYNPIGTVHGGFDETLLDSALGCAIFSTIANGEAWTTLELKCNLVRRLTKDTGLVRAEGRVVHRGRSVATATYPGRSASRAHARAVHRSGGRKIANQNRLAGILK